MRGSVSSSQESGNWRRNPDYNTCDCAERMANSSAAMLGVFSHGALHKRRIAVTQRISPLSRGEEFCAVFVSISDEHTSALQYLMRNSYADVCLKQQKIINQT